VLTVCQVFGARQRLDILASEGGTIVPPSLFTRVNSVTYYVKLVSRETTPICGSAEYVRYPNFSGKFGN